MLDSHFEIKFDRLSKSCSCGSFFVHIHHHLNEKERDRERERAAVNFIAVHSIKKLCLIDIVLMEINGSLLTMYLTIKFAIIEELNENRCSILSTIKLRIAILRSELEQFETQCFFAFYLLFLYAVHVMRTVERTMNTHTHTHSTKRNHRENKKVYGRNETNMLYRFFYHCLLRSLASPHFDHTFHFVEIQMKILEHSRAKT